RGGRDGTVPRGRRHARGACRDTRLPPGAHVRIGRLLLCALCERRCGRGGGDGACGRTSQLVGAVDCTLLAGGGARVGMQRNDVFPRAVSSGTQGHAMRKLTTLLFLIAAVGFLGTGSASAPALLPTPSAICKAAAQASMVAKAGCRVVRRCGYFGCSYEQVC